MNDRGVDFDDGCDDDVDADAGTNDADDENNILNVAATSTTKEDAAGAALVVVVDLVLVALAWNDDNFGVEQLCLCCCCRCNSS